jgi:hypothetical protein
MIKKIISAITSLAFLLIFFAPFSLAADTTKVVIPSDLATSFGDVIASPSSWFFYNDENDTINNTLGSFVSGPATPPLGTDSIQISVTGTQRRNLATYQFSGTPLASITSLSFSTYNPSLGNGGSINRSGYLNFNVDFNGTDTWQKRLVFVPSQNGTVVQNTWQEWDAIQSGNAKWVYSGATWPVTGEAGTSFKSWSQILTDYPLARVRVTDSWFGIRVGEPYADGYTENIDNIKFGTALGTTTFNFETILPDTTAPALPVHVAPLNNSTVLVHDFNFDWTDASDASSPVSYSWEASLSPAINPDGSFTSPLAIHNDLTSSEVFSPGTPDGVYYWHVMASDAKGNKTAWTTAWKVTVNTVIVTPTPVLPPTNKNQCKNDGWKIFNNPAFKNQGECTSFVEKHDKDDDEKCEKNGWRGYLNRVFKNEKDCKDNHDKDDDKKDKNKSVESEGKFQMSGPRQQFKFDISDFGPNSIKDKGEVEYWNYEYQVNKTLHYKAKSICSTLDKAGKKARIMLQIPAGYPGLSGLYIVVGINGNTSYGHSATTDLATAKNWCETGLGFSPASYPVTSGIIKFE